MTFFTNRDVADYYKTGKSDHNKLLEQWRKTWSMSFFMTSNAFVNIMKQAGFKHLTTKNITENIVPASKRTYHTALLGVVPSVLYNLTNHTSRFAKNRYLTGIYQYRVLKKQL